MSRLKKVVSGCKEKLFVSIFMALCFTMFMAVNAFAAVTLTSPDGGEVWLTGSTHAITWTNNLNPKPAAKLRLRYTKDLGVTWKTIVTRPLEQVLPALSGSYNWTVPVGATSKRCKVKVILLDSLGNILATDVSNSRFTIKSPDQP